MSKCRRRCTKKQRPTAYAQKHCFLNFPKLRDFLCCAFLLVDQCVCLMSFQAKILPTASFSDQYVQDAVEGIYWRSRGALRQAGKQPLAAKMNHRGIAPKKWLRRVANPSSTDRKGSAKLSGRPPPAARESALTHPKAKMAQRLNILPKNASSVSRSHDSVA